MYMLYISFFSLTFLGTSYFQVDEGLLIISGMCVFSTTSALFMFPAMYPYYTRALEVYKFEKADGVGKAYDLVIQGFVHFSFLALFPMIFAVTAIYLLVSFEPLFYSCPSLSLSLSLSLFILSLSPSLHFLLYLFFDLLLVLSLCRAYIACLLCKILLNFTANQS